jgi:hypothetical protein
VGTGTDVIASSDILKFVQLFCYRAQHYEIFLDHSTSLGGSAAIGNTEMSKRAHHIQWSRKVFQKTFTLLVVTLLRLQNVVQSFVLVSHHRQT